MPDLSTLSRRSSENIVQLPPGVYGVNTPLVRQERSHGPGRVTPHSHRSVRRVMSLQKLTANELPSKLKEKPCYYYPHPFSPISTMSAEVLSVSFSSSSWWLYCFAANG